MKSKSKALTVAAPQLPATQPPPRKADIICALVERARIKHEEENNILIKRRREAEDAAKEAILKELKDTPENFDVYVRPTYHHPEVEFLMKVIPPHIKKLREAIESVPSTRNFDPAQVKRDITVKLSGGVIGDRVQALLANPEAVKKLDETLESIGI